MATDPNWAQLASELPFTALMVGVVLFLVRWSDRRMDRQAQVAAGAAEQRQQQIVVLLERVLQATASLETKVTSVVEHNTQVIESNNTALLRVAEAMATLSQGQTAVTAQMTEVSRTLLEHERNVAARPCQQQAPKRRGGSQ